MYFDYSMLFLYASRREVISEPLTAHMETVPRHAFLFLYASRREVIRNLLLALDEAARVQTVVATRC